MVLYNTTFMENATGFSDIVYGIGDSIGQPYLIGYLLLLGFFLVFLVFTYKHGLEKSFITGGFLTTLISILLYYANLVNEPVIAYPFVIMILGVIFLFLTR